MSRYAALILAGLLLISASPICAQKPPTHHKPAAGKAAAAESAVRFEDVAKAAGLSNFTLTCGGAEKRYIMESLCGGVAFFDYDNDGWADILLVNGSTLEAVKNPRSADCAKFETRLYHNNHN